MKVYELNYQYGDLVIEHVVDIHSDLMFPRCITCVRLLVCVNISGIVNLCGITSVKGELMVVEFSKTCWDEIPWIYKHVYMGESEPA